MGDLESDFLELIKENVNFCKIDILFAPHHGRGSGKISEDWPFKINPKIIIIGEAPSENLNYYSNYNTITQNTAGDIVFDCENGEVDIYVSNDNYKVNFLEDKNKISSNHGYYLGPLEL